MKFKRYRGNFETNDSLRLFIYSLSRFYRSSAVWWKLTTDHGMWRYKFELLDKKTRIRLPFFCSSSITVTLALESIDAETRALDSKKKIMFIIDILLQWYQIMLNRDALLKPWIGGKAQCRYKTKVCLFNYLSNLQAGWIHDQNVTLSCTTTPIMKQKPLLNVLKY